MTTEHDDRDLLSESGQSRRDLMLPIMQEAMRNATRQRRQRRSLAASLVLLVAAFIGWELLEVGMSTPRAPESTLVDSSKPIPSTNIASSSLGTAETAATTKQKWDWAPFDPIATYNESIADGILVSSDPANSLPATWIIDRTVVDDVPRVTSNELVGLLADSGITAGILCDSSKCTLRIVNQQTSDEETPPSMPLSQDSTHDNVPRKTAVIRLLQSPKLGL